MKNRFIFFLFLTNVFVNAQDVNQPWGVYSWAFWNSKQATKENAPLIKGGPLIIHWDKLEPQKGNYKFDRFIGEKLKQLVANDYYTFLMIWVGPSSPNWVYENGVPRLEMEKTINPLGKQRTWTFPYYFHENYKKYFHSLIAELGRYLQELPQEQLDRILFIQAAEGSTGDGQPYKGRPLEKSYWISKSDWEDFRIETWEKYKAAATFNGKQQFPLLVNFDSKNEKSRGWILSNKKSVGLKNGMFSHGYHISQGKDRLKEWNSFTSELSKNKIELVSRGEQDAEWSVYGWSTQNPKQALYWSAIYATHNGLHMWNVPWKACLGYEYQDAIRFFNNYANEHNAKTATRAFIALRKGLDASDVISYPEEMYGKAKRSNIKRYEAIAMQHAQYGAMQGDPIKAIGGGMLNRQRQDYNDVGWGILDSNYERFIRQIEPETTSLGWWHIGPKESVYSRFARGTNVKENQSQLFFDISDTFAKDLKKLKISIIYLDQGKAKWSLLYASKNFANSVAYSIENTNTGKWLRKEIVLPNTAFKNNGSKHADFSLKTHSNEDVVFHLVEIEKL